MRCCATLRIMPNAILESPKKSPKPESKQSLLDRLAVVVGGLSAVVRQAPIAVAFVVLAIVLYFRPSDQPQENIPQFKDPATMQKEQPPPPPDELPPGMNPSVWTC